MIVNDVNVIIEGTIEYVERFNVFLTVNCEMLTSFMLNMQCYC